MKLSIFPRTPGKKSSSRQSRRDGAIPANLYGLKQAPQAISVKGQELQAVLRGVAKGMLATTVIELQEGSKHHKVLVKEVQYHPTTYAIEHIDFLLLADEVLVQVNVPIQILGLAECVGAKLGGFMRQVIRSLKVSCLPKDMPKEFTLDIRDLNIAQVKRLSDIAIPPGVKPLAKLNEVAVVIAKKV